MSAISSLPPVITTMLRDDQQKQQLLSLLKWMQTSSISSLSSIIATIEHSLTFALFNERFPDAIIHYICMTFIHFKEVPILMQVNRRFHSILPRQLLVSSNTAFNLIFTGALLIPIQHLRLMSSRYIHYHRKFNKLCFMSTWIILTITRFA
jgi:hypothetical protein